MIPLHIDLSEVVAEFALTSDQAQGLGAEIISRITTEYVSKWENLVNKGLRQTRTLYKKSMYVDRISGTEVVFGLSSGENGLALALEEGKPPFDEKPGFASSSKKKSKIGGGWYLTVPFRYATPGAVAESDIFQGVLPKEVYKALKDNPNKSLRTNQLPTQYSQLGRRAELKNGNAVIPEYVHKTPKYEGLVRLDISSTVKENRGGYFTFRRVSDKSEPLSWIHPGFDAHNFMGKALDSAQINIVADIAIDSFLKQIV